MLALVVRCPTGRVRSCIGGSLPLFSQIKLISMTRKTSLLAASVLSIVLFAGPALALGPTGFGGSGGYVGSGGSGGPAAYAGFGGSSTSTSGYAGSNGSRGSACPNITTTLYQGMTDGGTGGQVTQLQQFLSAHFGVKDIISGYFGVRTGGYVRQFRAEQGLAAGGVAGPLTRAAIRTFCDGATQSPDGSMPTGYSTSPCGYTTSGGATNYMPCSGGGTGEQQRGRELRVEWRGSRNPCRPARNRGRGRR